MNIFIDIETIPSPTPPLLEDIAAPANYKSEEAIAKYRASKQENEWRKESLNAIRGQVLCIGWAVDDKEPQCAYSQGSEKELMIAWNSALPKMNIPPSWVGHNSQSFDMLWIRLRALKYKMRSLAARISIDKYRGNVKDTMLMLGGGYGKYFSLSDACAFFGLEGKLSGMDGSKVFDYWREGKHSEIVAYCKQDVAAMRELYCVLNEEG